MVNKAFDNPEELDPQAVAKANFDLAERLAKDGVTVAYDEDGDTPASRSARGSRPFGQEVAPGNWWVRMRRRCAPCSRPP